MARMEIGFLGSGQATQAIHLPSLAKLGRQGSVRTVMDVSGELARIVADRSGARATTDERDIYDDDRIDIVVIGSPNRFHAEQTIACCKAGKKVVLCEKPLAVNEAEARAIFEAASASGTAIIVGNMHSFDPAVRRAREAWSILEEQASVVRSAIYLPTNDLFVSQASDALAMPMPAMPNNRPAPADGERLRNAVLGLAVHNLPLVREFLPSPGVLAEAHLIEPYGYSLSLTGERHAALLSALMPGQWPPQWSFVAISDECVFRATFPPSYVLAGSAKVELVRYGETTVIEEDRSGYEMIWEHIFGICQEEEAPRFGLDSIIADLDFALDIAGRAETMMTRTA